VIADTPASPRAVRRSPWQDASKVLVEVWKTLRKRWIWVVTLTVSGLIVAGFYTAGQQRIYRSSCVIQIDPKPPKPLGTEVQAIVDVGANSYWANAEYYKTQFQIIQSRAVAEETVRRLSLHRNVAFLRGLGPNEPLPASPGPAASMSVEESIAIAANVVRSRLSVEPTRETRLVTIAFTDANPERARQILAALVGVYVDRNVDVALDSTNTAADWLRGQVDKLKQELESSENALHDYKTGNRILSVSLDDQSNMLRQEMQQLSAALTSVRVRRTQVAAQAEELAKLGDDPTSDLSNLQLLRDPTLQTLRNTLVLALAEQESLIGSGKGENHPLVASAAARVKASREALEQEVQNVRLAAQRELSMVSQEESSMAALLDHAQARAQDLAGLEVEYRRLERSKTQTEKLYSLVIERSKESDLTRMMRFNNIQTIDPPIVPKAPISPRVPINMAIGLVGGIALGLFGAFAREMFDQSVKTPADIEQDLGMTFLGMLPRLGSGSSGYTYSRRRARKNTDAAARAEWVVHEDPTSAISEAARGVRTNLSFMSPDKPYHTFLVTSAAPSEGKTTVACWLATAMAQAGHRVLLVDCDLRRPRLHRIFGLVNESGVTSALVDRAALKEAVHTTEIPGLSVLLSGPTSPSPAESLQSKSFENLLADMSAAYDRVVIDSPPVGPVTDAVILSTRVDASVLVVRSLATSRDVVRHAKKALQDVRANLAGAVLNAADPSRQGYSYYHRYYGKSEGDTDSSSA
jgi:succinoglycan biosynthesis transport protein ExoP